VNCHFPASQLVTVENRYKDFTCNITADFQINVCTLIYYFNNYSHN